MLLREKGRDPVMGCSWASVHKALKGFILFSKLLRSASVFWILVNMKE